MEYLYFHAAVTKSKLNCHVSNENETSFSFNLFTNSLLLFIKYFSNVLSFPSPRETSYLTWRSWVVSTGSKTGLIQLCLAKRRGWILWEDTSAPPPCLHASSHIKIYLLSACSIYWNSRVMSHHSSFLPFFTYWITKGCGHPLAIQSEMLLLCYHAKFHDNMTHLPCVNYSGIMILLVQLEKYLFMLICLCK